MLTRAQVGCQVHPGQNKSALQRGAFYSGERMPQIYAALRVWGWWGEGSVTERETGFASSLLQIRRQLSPNAISKKHPTKIIPKLKRFSIKKDREQGKGKFANNKTAATVMAAENLQA